ncbi:hypothetical protein DM02DRAFT_732938 [Periconia macrospinosa]|uniref:BRCT domain-containing protein n=1 Tax=Periconia macrospinosa TaxID=97972 RepID=A0A2V1D6Q3_9PLEO|nr:hypothetical protein DM02DRAFT_732938 [Periconia macrospinosa]
MGNSLKGLVITATGDLGPGKGPDQLRKWVDANGGRWVPRVQKGITHLVTEKEAWKKNSEAVQQAKKLGVYIVSFDWLEDSLQKGRKVAEKKYTWEHIRMQRRMSKAIKRHGVEHDTKKFNEGCAKALEDIGSGMSSTKPSRARNCGFFASSMDYLQEKREEREKAEKEKREAKAAAAQATNPTEDTTATPPSTTIRDPGLEILRQAVQASSSSLPNHNALQAQRKTTSKLAGSRISKPTPSKKKIVPAPKKASLSSQPPSNLTPSTTATTPPSTTSTARTKNKLTDLYHAYMDSTGFIYDLEFVRRNPILNTFAKYDLRLYESNTVPHVYCTFVRYTPPSHAREMKISSAANIVVEESGRVQNKRSLSSSTSNFVPATGTTTNNADTSTNETTPTMTPAEAQRAHLDAIIAPAHLSPSQASPPPPDAPFKILLAPANSTYEAAFHAFRHAFREITLLTWEERREDPCVSPPTTPSLLSPLPPPNAQGPSSSQQPPTPTPTPTHFSTQRLRAQAFNIEPFLWNNRPVPGAPYGVFPALPSYPTAPTTPSSTSPPTTPTTTYPLLPAVKTPLSSSSGAYGSLQVREAAAVQARIEADEKKEKERVAAIKKEQNRIREKERYRARQPLFNGVNGPPPPSPWRRYTSSVSPMRTATLSPGIRGNGGGGASSPYRPPSAPASPVLCAASARARTMMSPAARSRVSSSQSPVLSLSPGVGGGGGGGAVSRAMSNPPGSPASSPRPRQFPAVFTHFPLKRGMKMWPSQREF